MKYIYKTFMQIGATLHSRRQPPPPSKQVVLCEMMWLKNLLKELQVLKNEIMLLHYDNVAEINMANNLV